MAAGQGRRWTNPLTDYWRVRKERRGWAAGGTVSGGGAAGRGRQQLGRGLEASNQRKRDRGGRRDGRMRHESVTGVCALIKGVTIVMAYQ